MTKRGFFVFFLVSGFCGLVYEVVWLRLAMAQFGVTTALISIVLSVFMGGLALGSWLAGWCSDRLEGRDAALFLRLYAAAELIVAGSRDAVPWTLAHGRRVLEDTGSGAWGSAAYHLASGVWVSAALLPFCVAMGATFPLAMAAIRRSGAADSSRSFSYLYVANVVGATLGTLGSAYVLIELFGFRGTLSLAAMLNAVLAASALLLSLAPAAPSSPAATASGDVPTAPADGLTGSSILWALFCTGLVSMALEVLWVRLLTPYLGNVVYAFAVILTLYLVATFASSAFYRWRSGGGRGGRGVSPGLWGAMSAAGVLILPAADPRWGGGGAFLAGLERAAVGIVPFCALVGYATPLLVDRWSRGDPKRAGGAYAVNVVGCIVGPLVAGFWLMPAVGGAVALLILGAPLLALGLAARRPADPGKPQDRRRSALSLTAAAAVGLTFFMGAETFESQFQGALVLRDSTATVTAVGSGMRKQLLVNGVGMTVLSPITKLMVHLPLSFQAEPPRSVLIICFGMGTTFRSSLTWGVDTTAVELVPSVPATFGFFHSDASSVLASPRAHIVIDDGRRFLERSRRVYDAIVIDPPPPVSAAGSSLLYSQELCEIVRKSLSPHGIFQQWVPSGDATTIVALTRALQQSFPHVRAFTSVEGWGLHLLASREPIPGVSGETLARRLPPAAAKDMVEWSPSVTPQDLLQAVLDREVPIERILAVSPGTPALRDDRPVNEYYFLRRLRHAP